MVLATYRNDELHRRHPLRPTVQGWRRAGFADILELQEISENEVGDVISAIFDTNDLSGDLMHFMHKRSEGNRAKKDAGRPATRFGVHALPVYG